jgi:NADPH:quinone reductase-like Zn-dependent oxidoreductase
MRAVRFHEYGSVDALGVERVPRPEPGPGQALVQVKAAGINPGEAMIREGVLHDLFPATFPSGQGSDLAGVIAGEGAGDWAPGDEVVGFTDNRASHAELVVVDTANLTRRPAGVGWEEAGALFVAGTTAYAALAALELGPGDTVVITAAAGGVGSISVQLAALAGARVIGLASPDNHGWLADHGAIPIAHGDGVEDRIRAIAPAGVDAMLDAFGDGYVELGLRLGIDPARIDTIADPPAAERYGVRSAGNREGASAAVMSELLELMATGRLQVPIAATFPLNEVRSAFRLLERRRTHGKIVLIP